MIQHATQEDAEWIKKIYSESKKEIGSFNLFYSWVDYIEKGIGTFIIVPGKAFIRYKYSSKYKAYVVYEIGVLKSERGKGHGEFLMKQVPTPIILKCNQDNEGGNAFYKKLGMKLSGTTSTKKGNLQNIYLCVEW